MRGTPLPGVAFTHELALPGEGSADDGRAGIDGKEVTSLSRLLGRKIDEREVEERLIRHFAEEFGFSRIEERRER